MRTNNDALGLQDHNQVRSSLPAEARLILACARADAAAVPEDEVRELLEQPLDWGAVHRAAFSAGYLPFLHLHLNRIAPQCIPEDTRKVLAAFSEGIRERNLLLLELMLELHARFEQHGVAAMPYVEALSSFASYRQPGLRACTWLDFAIPPGETPKAQQVLRATGLWKELPDPGSEWLPVRRQATGVWAEGPYGSAVSLHAAAAMWPRAIRLEMSELWTRQVRVQLGQKTLLAPSPEDTLVHLCVQNSEYLWVALRGINDVAEVLGANPALDWGTTFERARRCGVLRMTLLGMHLAASLLNAPLPQVARKRILQDAAVPRLAKAVVRELFHTAPRSGHTPEMLRFHLRLRERVSDRTRYVWRFVNWPSQVDRSLIPLPRSLQFLYSPLRMLRLGGALVKRAVRGPAQATQKSPRSISGYTPTAPDVVNRMLGLAGVGPSDVVYDLGCGDGRIVIEAARRFGARGVGMDIDAQRIREAEENARAAGVEGLVRFYQQDVMKAEFPSATVVMMYLPPEASVQLGTRLMREQAPGTRIVSHNADPAGWDHVEVFKGSGVRPSLLYLRKVPPPGAPQQ